MATESVKRFLLAPLDWGLGHTTRCVPLIQYLLSKKHEVILAGNEAQLNFLNKMFPGLEQWQLDGYDVRYSSSHAAFLFTMLSQVPRLLTVIRRERHWLKEKMEQSPVDGIISDNRYGLYHPDVPSVIITHQLQVQTGMGHFADELLRAQHYSFLRRFSKIWIADVRGELNLGGKLSHPSVLPDNAEYLGWLSQFEQNKKQNTGEHLLVLLSGPEPQRTILSKLLWEQLASLSEKIIFVEGSDDIKAPENIPVHIQYHKRLTGQALQPMIDNASMIICRSGYSTIMDITVMNKKAILIPTPGQTEQEYLGKQLHDAGVYYSTAQKDFNLSHTLEEAKNFPFKQLPAKNAHHQYREVLDTWLKSL